MQRTAADSGKATEQSLDVPIQFERFIFAATITVFEVVAVNFPMDVGSEDSHGAPVHPAPGWLFLLIVSLGMRSAGAVTIRLICGGFLYGSVTCCFVCPDTPPTIPNDYPSSTTIPKLNCCFPERSVTMQEIYADRCREEHCWGED